MKFGVLGTGVVGRTLSEKLAGLGHEVTMGTRDVQAALARTEPDRFGGPPLREWLVARAAVRLGTFEQAAASGDIIVNATAGTGALAALEFAGAANLSGKVLMDISNPLDFTPGEPMKLSVCNDDSLAEQIQRTFPGTRVVKTLNTVTARLMVEPGLVPGEHSVFVSGDDPDAKAQVVRLLEDELGWQSVIDLGDLTTARSAEMFLPLWLNLMMVQGTPLFNIQIVR